MPSVFAQTVKPQSSNRGYLARRFVRAETKRLVSAVDLRGGCPFLNRFRDAARRFKIPFTIPASDRPKQPPSGSRVSEIRCLAWAFATQSRARSTVPQLKALKSPRGVFCPKAALGAPADGRCVLRWCAQQGTSFSRE